MTDQATTNEPPDEGGADDNQTITVDVQPRKVSRVSRVGGVRCKRCGPRRPTYDEVRQKVRARIDEAGE